MLKSVTTRSISAAVACALSFAAAHAAADPPKQINVPPGDLIPALEAIQKQAAIEIVFQPEQLKSFHTGGVKGALQPEEAVRILLKGIPLEIRIDRTGAMAIVPPRGKPLGESASARDRAGNHEVENRSRDRLQLAQVDHGESQSTSSAADGTQSSSEKRASQGNVQLEEVIVTANRRTQTLEEVPYSITAISAQQIANAGVTDIASLANQVPGLSMYDYGTRSSGSVFPIIRGLNASASAGGTFRTFEQSPVGTYIGNSPIDGYFQFDDVQRVEVLKGPQGTLYGAGALGGALRIIPNAPQLRSFSGTVEAGGGTLAHSSGAGYTASGVLNVPIGDTLAFRVAGKYAYEPGFIDVYGILERTGAQAGGVPVVSGIPVLANPSAPVTSSGIFTGKDDWNDQNTFTGRSSLLWEPAEQFNVELAFLYAKANGDGAPGDNSVFQGGPYPIDPRISFPAGGKYRAFTASDQPFSRTTKLTSLDLSYDAGFATLSSTSSYYTTMGSLLGDGTYSNATFPGFLAPGYYGGNPINPRYANVNLFSDSAHTFTQEVRLVSTTGPDKLFDYVAGVFYERQERFGSLNYAQPGSPEYSRAQGCTAPYSFGASFPNCLVVAGPGDVTWQLLDTQRFTDKSEFGELTWHFVRHGQITFGGRHFKQTFTDLQSYSDWPFATFVPAVEKSAPASKNTWKINPSYEYASGQHLYALWSQGFRRGGANALPQIGPFQENPALFAYASDSVNNYEIGLKGRFANGLSYTFAVFDVQWDKPQVAGSTPVGNFAVWNGNKAQSKGLEFDLNSPLFLPGLTVTISGAYADATFTKSYLITDGIFGNISAAAGQQLPGSPKTSSAATINYERKLASGYDLTASLNDTYRSAMYLSTFPIGLVGQTSASQVPGMNIVNLSASVNHQSWHLGLYVTNVADKRAILSPGTLQPQINNLTYANAINRPRESALRLGYSF